MTAALSFAYFDESKFVENIVATTLKKRFGKDNRAMTDKSKKGVIFSDYKMEQPTGRGQGRQWANMGPTHQGVTMIRFVWRKSGTEAQRLKELDDLLAKNGLTLD